MLQITSQSHCLLLATSHPCRSSHRCLTIISHLSLPALPRERFEKVAQPCCNYTVPVARPLAVGIARRPGKHVFDEDQTKGGQKRNGEASAARRVLSKTTKWQRPGSSSGDPQMMGVESQSIADGMHGSENRWESQTSGSMSHRLERIELLNDHRDELLLQCAQSRRLLEGFLCRTCLVEGDVASFQPFAAARAQGKAYNEAARGQKKHQMGTALHVSVRCVRQWPDDGNSWINRTGRGRDGVAARVSQEARLGTGRGSFPRDVERSRDPPERETSTHSGTIQDVRTRSFLPSKRMHRASPNWRTFYAKFFYHRKGIEQEGPAPPTNNERKIQLQLEQRRKKVEGKYAQGMKLTSMRLISQNRWPCGVLERKTRSSNELLFSSGVTPLISCEEF